MAADIMRFVEGMEIAVEDDAQTEMLAPFLAQFTTVTGWQPEVKVGGNSTFQFTTDPAIGPEAYQLGRHGRRRANKSSHRHRFLLCHAESATNAPCPVSCGETAREQPLGDSGGKHQGRAQPSAGEATCSMFLVTFLPSTK